MLNIKIKISLIFFISIVNYVFLHLIHDANWITLVEASFDVANRTPHWRVNQSRLMGPILLKLITLFGFISEQWALRLFMMFFVTFNNLLLAVCLSNMTNSKQKILNTLIIFNALLIISQDVWLYVWDFIDISFFIFYGFILFKEEYIKYLVPINFLHIFNRESALIMAVFFLLLIYTKDKNLTKLFKKNYVIGLIFNLTFGVLYIVLSKLILPKISDNLESRKSQILENIETAEKQREESEKKLKEFDKIILESKLEAKNQFNEVRQKILEDISNKRIALEKDIDKEIKSAEEEINNLKINSSEKIKNIAIETSSELTKQLIGEEANNSSISAIVEEQSKKNKENKYGI